MSGGERPALGVGMVGHAFMGRVHSQAWRSVHAFFDVPYVPVMVAVAGRSRDRVRAAADRLGWASAETDWKALLRRDDIDLIDICTPGDTHAEIAIAALDAGKHVLCEKPLANTVAEAEAMTAAAERAAERGVRAMVAFNYRRVPAIALARRLVADGRLGAIRHVRAQYLQDWLTDPEQPLTWRLQRDKAGSGALGDIGAHIIDAAQFITGERITGVTALTETFVRERPVGAGGGERGPVTVDDAALFLARTTGGAVAAFEATRFATGRKNALRIEINGSKGSLAFDFEAMNELWFHDAALGDAEGGFRRILVTEADHPYAGAWWPPGHLLGYEHTFTHEIADLLSAIAAGTDPSPSFADGLQVQRVLAAVEASAAAGGGWTPVP
ncbi:Gfo/Idh/MocA family protein [Thermomonospora cellulosilytica]|uniref:Putative dehydrogenase n=1 Tax=Thermomonospora cellulosilytica TaxID=1411118 RepID=A0A7W3RBZ9_9ACTN|nr:Gfo/Idh/MocA family oxidoreductase [Thermomonospora cellulosilytica]MBA9007441.1 putative dehydrogenase [Thermomonospora cellulosilytica]